MAHVEPRAGLRWGGVALMVGTTSVLAIVALYVLLTVLPAGI